MRDFSFHNGFETNISHPRVVGKMILLISMGGI